MLPMTRLACNTPAVTLKPTLPCPCPAPNQPGAHADWMLRNVTRMLQAGREYGAGSAICDLGAGTGNFTATLVS